ncbi:hypothetical protein [Brevibacillus daliensis]|uniref:hypothetical protein n=1 Tax=Brevibacillus daliensis TaxID=2892995 RepID=UPI001E428E76|nr:hypothetical protein [Brevibacillus daliensis]
MRKIAVLYSGNSHQHRTFYEPKYKAYLHKIVYLPELSSTTLDDVDVLIVPSQLHQRQVSKNLDIIMGVVNRGGTIVALGAQSQNWFPGHNWEFRPTNFWWWLEKDAKSGLILRQPEHDLFRYINLLDATWHYHGVFFPPVGAETLIEVDGDGAIMYIDKVSTPGTLIMTTLDPEYHYGSYFMPATERFLTGFLPWLAEGSI